MIRSRLFLLLLLLIYLGVTPAGVFTCICFAPNQAFVPLQVGLDDLSEPTTVTHTAVSAILNYFSVSFLLAVAFSLRSRFRFSHTYLLQWLEPFEFKLPPPTPPPFVAA